MSTAALLERMDALDSGALFSPCRRWRYLLWRRWYFEPDAGTCMFIGLNPSTADEMEDDPTIRRCIGFARGWGYGSLWMLNAFAFRATDPRVMKAEGANAIGPLNNEYITQCARQADVIVAAWGTHCPELREREIRMLVNRAGKPLCHLGLTQAGHPKHPLYLRADTPLQPWPSDPLNR